MPAWTCERPECRKHGNICSACDFCDECCDLHGCRFPKDEDRTESRKIHISVKEEVLNRLREAYALPGVEIYRTTSTPVGDHIVIVAQFVIREKGEH